MSEQGDFYVGYLPTAPPSIGRFVRLWVAVALLIAAGVATAVTIAQRPFAVSRFEFGVVRSFEGVVRAQPRPVLEVTRTGSGDAVSRYLLVAPFKHGADALIAPFVGQRVRLEGSLIYRDGRTMIELVPDRIEALGVGTPKAPARPLGRQTLVGEIVDSKCWLGLMKPGDGKPHRACAVRCISGGIPPLFVARDRAGETMQLLLVGPAGEALGQDVLDRVAEPVEITGDVSREGDLLVMRASPSAIRALR